MLSRIIFMTCILLTTNAWAEWTDVNESLKLKSIKPLLCSEFTVANETEISIDSETCLRRGQFHVFKKYLTNYQDKVIVTLMKLKIRVENVECDGKIKKTFGHYYVNYRGEVVYQKPGFEVTYVDNCELISNILIIDSTISDSHVKKMTKTQYYKLPSALRKNIESVDISLQLDLELETRYKKFYKIFKDNNLNQIAGYLVYSFATDLISDEEYEVLVRYDSAGNQVGPIEY